MDSVSDILPQIANFVGDSGVCSDSPKVLAALNDARQVLWAKGDFPGTTDYLCLCCVECRVTLPSRYLQIRQAYVCNRPLDLHGEWFQATAGLASCCGTLCGNYRTITEVGGYHATFREFNCPFYLQIVGEDIRDKGTEITFTTLDTSQKRQVTTFTVGEPWQVVEQQSMLVSVLQAVKPKTFNRIRVYAFNPYTGLRAMIALYEGSDINPSFKRFKMPTQCGEKLIALCKLKYFPLTEQTQLVEFDINALIPALLAINARKNRNQNDYLANLNIAVLEANKTMSDGEAKGSTPMKVYGMDAPQSLLPAV